MHRGGHRRVVLAQRYAHFELAATHALLERFANERLRKAQRVVDAKREVEKARIDRATFDGHGAERRGAVGEGVTGHAGNMGHGDPLSFL